MKTLRKSVAVILSLIMLISALPMISASAETVYKELTLNTKEKVKLSGEKVTLSFTPEIDGWYEFCSIGDYDTYAALYNSDFEMLSDDDDSGDDWNFSVKNKLYAGQVYYLSVDGYGAEYMTFSVNVTVKETVGVESMEITQYPDDMTCIKDYEAQTVDFTGLKIDFTLSDGEVVSYAYDGKNFYVSDFYVYFEDGVDENGEFYYEVSCGNAREKIYFTMAENPIERIEYVCETPIEYYENTNGRVTETGSFYYSVVIPDDATLDIYYKDGTKESLSEFVYHDGVRISSSQIEQPWGVGTNYLTVSYLGVETQVAVEILETPIKSVTVNSAPHREYFYGDEEYGYVNGVGRYEFTPSDLSGLSFTVEYFDGTVETFTDNDIDMERGTIGGEYYEINDCYAVNPRTVPVTLTFKGFDIKYNINVIESPIKNIEVIFGPDNCFYENRFYPIFDGTQLRVTFSDGTEKVITMSDENTYYGDGEYLSYEVEDEDVTIKLYESYNEYDEIVYIFNCIDKWAYYDGLYYEESREISDVSVDKFTPDGDNMIITVFYADGSSDTLSFDTVSYKDYENGQLKGFAKTENGVTGYEITQAVENGEMVYKLNVLGKNVTLDEMSFELGDVDTDKVVSIMDATSIAFYLAEIDTLSSKRLELADVDKDGVVSIMDATAIQLSLAEI